MLKVKERDDCSWDLISLGEVMIRFDPGDDRIQTARSFRVWEGGGEYNVARNLSKCFRLRTGIITALAENQIGRLVEDLILQGGVDTSNILWRETDGMSRSVRNGVYFMERGFGLRSPNGCSDRGNTAVSQLKPGDIDWQSLFGVHGVRWFHTGGIFAGLSESTAQVAAEGMSIARANGAVVSFDLNYRESIWAGRGGREAANQTNSELLPFADVVFGVENFPPGVDEFSDSDFRKCASAMISRYSNVKALVTTLRDIRSSSRHDIGGACFVDGTVFRAQDFENVEVLDRVGSGDAFAAGFIACLLQGKGPQSAIDIAVAGAVLSLASPGDGLSATRVEIERLVTSRDSSAVR